MIDEQEHPGASNSSADAPPISLYRSSGQRVKPTKKALDSQVVLEAPPRNRGRKRARPTANSFQLHNDKNLPTPPPTQLSSQSTQPARKRRQTNTSQRTAKQKEPWEEELAQLNNTSEKRDFLLEFLGREDFTTPLQVPQRDPAIADGVFDRELDPWDPIYVWYKLVTPEVLETISQNTNENEASNYDERPHHSHFERTWHDTSGADIGAFIGAQMLMEVHPAASVEDYWITSADAPVYPISETFSRERFEQISRHFKVSRKDEEEQFYHKVEPLSTVFRENSKRLIIPGSTLSIDENLVKAKVRSKHLLQISNKVAGKGYKVYTLCDGSYCYDFPKPQKQTRHLSLEPLHLSLSNIRTLTNSQPPSN
jgi:hypothetical protein